ncbi:hypothetical protein HpCOL19_14500 [Helicobacter pylori]|nr:hypothetical protein [Helicobacter pylori]
MLEIIFKSFEWGDKTQSFKIKHIIKLNASLKNKYAPLTID